MKKTLTIFITILCFFSFLTVDAKKKTTKKKETTKTEVKEEKKETISCKNKVDIYIFHGDGCPHCAEALEFFESIQEEYGSCFNLNKYEVWYDQDNNKLMQQVAEFLGEEVSGVPYIIIGQNTYKGFSSAYSDEIKAAIVNAANDDNFIDVVKKATAGEEKDDKSNVGDTIVTIAIIVVLVGGVVALVLTSKPKKEN